MNLGRVIICTFCLWLLVNTAMAKTVTVVSAEWPGLTAADGSGLYFQVLREALATQDIDLRIRVSNWKRAKQMFYAGRADMLLADFRSEPGRYLYPNWHIDTDPPVLVFTRQPISQLSAIEGKAVAWRLGYDFDQLLPFDVQGIEVEDEQIGYELLSHGRLDAVIGYQHNIPPALAGKFAGLALAPAQKIYPVLKMDFAGRQLAAAFDRGMQRLYDSGRLQILFGERFVAAGFPAQP